MSYVDSFTQSEEFRRQQLLQVIEHSIEHLTLQELEALHYDMSTKGYILSPIGH